MRNLDRGIGINTPDEAKNLAKIDNGRMIGCFNLISGHFAYEGDINIPRCFKYITVLRNPVDRLLSTYNFFNSPKGSSHGVAKAMKEKNMTFLDLIHTQDPTIFYWVHSNTMFMGGVGTQTAHLDMDYWLDKALYNLQFNFDFVGIADRLDDTVYALNKKYGIKGKVKQLGKTPDDKKYEPSDEEIETAKHILRCDIILYNYAKKLFNETYNEFVKKYFSTPDRKWLIQNMTTNELKTCGCLGVSESLSRSTDLIDKGFCAPCSKCNRIVCTRCVMPNGCIVCSLVETDDN